MKKDNRGGANRGQGRKPKFNEPSKVLSERVPISRFDELKAALKKMINNPLNK